MIRNRIGVSLAVATAAGLLVGCRGASFSDLSQGGGQGDDHATTDHGGDTEVASAHGPGPRLVFPEKTHNFGSVEQGEKIHHVFKLRNDGEGVLKIKRVRGS